MRISEIIKTTWQQPRPGSQTKIVPGTEDLGTGYFSVVKIDPEDPHLVIKQEKEFLDPQGNGFLHWAKQIQKHAEHNPYLPRIYEISPEILAPDQQRFTYKIERLFHGQKLSPDQVNLLAQKALTGAPAEQITDWYELIRYIRDHVKDPSRFRSEKLRQAIKLILDSELAVLGRTTHWPASELSQNNVMVRLHPLQMVITDPVISAF